MEVERPTEGLAVVACGRLSIGLIRRLRHWRLSLAHRKRKRRRKASGGARRQVPMESGTMETVVLVLVGSEKCTFGAASGSSGTQPSGPIKQAPPEAAREPSRSYLLWALHLIMAAIRSYLINWALNCTETAAIGLPAGASLQSNYHDQGVARLAEAAEGKDSPTHLGPASSLAKGTTSVAAHQPSIISRRTPANNGASFARLQLELKLIVLVWRAACLFEKAARQDPLGHCISDPLLTTQLATGYLASTKTTDGGGALRVTLGWRSMLLGGALLAPTLSISTDRGGSYPGPSSSSSSSSSLSRRQLYDYISIDCRPPAKHDTPDTGTSVAKPATSRAAHYRRDTSQGDKCTPASGQPGGSLGVAVPIRAPGGVSEWAQHRVRLIKGAAISVGPGRPRPARLDTSAATSSRLTFVGLLLALAVTLAAEPSRGAMTGARPSMMDASLPAHQHDKLSGSGFGATSALPLAWPPTGQENQKRVVLNIEQQQQQHQHQLEEGEKQGQDHHEHGRADKPLSSVKARNDNNDNNANLSRACAPSTDQYSRDKAHGEEDNYYDNSNHNGPLRADSLGRPRDDKLASDKIDKDSARLDWSWPGPTLRRRPIGVAKAADTKLSVAQWWPSSLANGSAHSDHVERLGAPEVATRRDRLRARREPTGRGAISHWPRGVSSSLSGFTGGEPSTSGCPQECTCNWKHGKQFADCSAHRNRLTKVPSGLDPLTQVLNLSANHLIELKRDTFSSLQLNNLQRIYLSNCQLESVQAGTFSNLRLVVELDFSWNQLTRVPVMPMRHLSLLRRLNMRGNPLMALDELSLGAGHPDQPTAPISSRSTNLDLARAELEGAGVDRLSRLVETYPEIVRFLLNQELAQPKLTPAELDLLEQAIGQLDDMSQLDTLGSAGPNGGAAPFKVKRQSGAQCCPLGSHFGQLQELDFGQCQLSYIKWSTFEQLGQLKKLWLDGNQLSQLSGRLVESLPIGLHQLSLEDNPWICDCRLRALGRWLTNSRTPLGQTVRCLAKRGTSDERPLLDRLTSEEFVCGPKAVFQVGLNALATYLEHTLVSRRSLESNRSSLSSSSSSAVVAVEQQSKIAPAGGANKTRHNLDTNEVERTIMSCSFYVYPESSVDIVWLVDYNSQGGSKMGRLGRSGRLPAEERFTVLYDSKLHLQRRMVTDSLQRGFRRGQQQAHFWSETYLYGSRVMVRESRPSDRQLESPTSNLVKSSQTSDSDNNIELNELEKTTGVLKETQIVILAAHIEDSARYKCMAVNRAGNSSLEFLLRVQPDPTARKKLYNSSAVPVQVDARDQQTQHSGGGQVKQAATTEVVADPSRRPMGQNTQTVVGAVASSSTLTGNWLKGSTSFRLTIVIVSVLMGAVILAFVLFCIIIYQIKPAPGPMNGPGTEPSTPRATNCDGSQSDWFCQGPQMAYIFDLPAMSQQCNHANKMGLIANCDPLTGQSPVHLLSSTSIQ